MIFLKGRNIYLIVIVNWHKKLSHFFLVQMKNKHLKRIQEQNVRNLPANDEKGDVRR